MKAGEGGGDAEEFPADPGLQDKMSEVGEIALLGGGMDSAAVGDVRRWECKEKVEEITGFDYAADADARGKSGEAKVGNRKRRRINYQL